MRKSHITIIRGVPGSGKTTFAKSLFPLAYDAICEADDFFITEYGYQFDPKKLNAAHKACQSRVSRLLSGGAHVIVSNTSTTWEEIDTYIKIAKNHGATIYIYEMTGEYDNVHGVPPEKVEIMRRRFIGKNEFMEKYKSVYGENFGISEGCAYNVISPGEA